MGKLSAFNNKLDVPWHGYVGVPIRPLTKDECREFAQCALLEIKSKTENMDAFAKEASNFSGFAILLKRLETAKSSDKISFYVVAFCALLSTSAGEAVMWAYTLNYMQVASACVIDFDEFVKWFGWGVPTKEAIDTAWDEQKKLSVAKPGSNWVDDFRNWP